MKNQCLLFLLLSTSFLTGCDKLRHTFGLDHYQADPFSVPKNPPLSMPVDYDLRPPEPGIQSPGHIDPKAQAAEKVLGKKPSPAPINGGAESFILKEAEKTSRLDPTIRSTVHKDAESDQSFTEKLQSIGSKALTSLSNSTTENKGKEKKKASLRSSNSKENKEYETLPVAPFLAPPS